MKDIILLRCHYFQKAILILSAVPTTITTAFTGRNRKENNLKIPMESQETMNNNLKKKKNKVEGLTFTDFKT